MRKNQSPAAQTVPFPMVGSNKFGRYPKVSSEQTWNMIVSDDFLVDYAGYKNVLNIIPNGSGRGIFNSSRSNRLIVVVNNYVYSVIISGGVPIATQVGAINTFSGDVFIDENDANQIAICDKSTIWIYNYIANTFTQASLDFTPGYVAFQDGYFIAPDIGTNIGSPKWRLSAINNGTSWPAGANNTGLFQTKPDQPVACIRFPSRGNLLFVMGKTVTEAWYDVGSFPFPYQRSQSYNLDYGCLNPATIASGDNFVVWLGQNEKSGPVVMYSTGGDVQQISNDGINFKFADLAHPEISYGFLFKQDGHLFYQITFPDPEDNITYTFDFNTKQFYSLCDENMSAHIAKRVAFFNNTYYFVSFIDGNLYQLDTLFTNYDYGPNQIFEIPRIRVCETIRLPNNTPFVANEISFEIEQGINSGISRVDLSISRNGGQSFGNSMSYTLRRQGIYQGKVNFWNLGYGKEFTPQFRFWSFGRFVIGNGSLSLYQ
jgi:hypothetical protein